MNKRLFKATSAIALSLTMTMVADAAITEVPEPFKPANQNSNYRINYDEVTNLLRHAVVNTGRSPREKGPIPMSGGGGERLRQTSNRATVYEGNRFFFEMFQKSDDAKNVLRNIKKGLETIPSKVPLADLSRDEQLAYWLNIYNITLINEISEIYPIRNLQNALVGENSILNKKTLVVAGVPLSLNDIEFILWENYNGRVNTQIRRLTVPDKFAGHGTKCHLSTISLGSEAPCPAQPSEQSVQATHPRTKLG